MPKTSKTAPSAARADGGRAAEANAQPQVPATPVPQKSAPSRPDPVASSAPAEFNVSEAISRVLRQSNDFAAPAGQQASGQEPSPDVREANPLPEPKDAAQPSLEDEEDAVLAPPDPDFTSEDSTQSGTADGKEITNETNEEESGDETEAGQNAQHEAPGQPRGHRWRQRVDGLTARLSEEKERTAALEREVQALKAKTDPAPDPGPMAAGSGLEHVRDLNALHKLQRETEAVMEWIDRQIVDLRRQPERVEGELRRHKLANGDEPLERDEMEARLIELKQNAERQMRAVPARAQYLHEREQAEQLTRERFPWWKDKSHENTLAAQRVLDDLQSRPLHLRPDAAFHANVYLLGVKALRAQAEAAAKPVAAKVAPKPPRVPQPGTGSPVASAGGPPDPLSSIRARLAKGDESAVRDFFAASLARKAA